MVAEHDRQRNAVETIMSHILKYPAIDCTDSAVVFLAYWMARAS